MKADYPYRMTMCGILPSGLLVLAAGLSVGGCATPRAKELQERRAAHLQQTFQMLEDNESSRPEQVRRDVDDVTARSRQDPARFPVTMEGVHEQIKAEQNRWLERQPGYREGIKRELDGKPQKAAETVPEMVY